MYIHKHSELFTLCVLFFLIQLFSCGLPSQPLFIPNQPSLTRVGIGTLFLDIPPIESTIESNGILILYKILIDQDNIDYETEYETITSNNLTGNQAYQALTSLGYNEFVIENSTPRPTLMPTITFRDYFSFFDKETLLNGFDSLSASAKKSIRLELNQNSPDLFRVDLIDIDEEETIEIKLERDAGIAGSGSFFPVNSSTYQPTDTDLDYLLNEREIQIEANTDIRLSIAVFIFFGRTSFDDENVLSLPYISSWSELLEIL